MNESPERGAIIVQSAYAQGKMLDCSGWKNLPRRITPSDVDLVFDNAGRMLLCELSTQSSSWEELKIGQRKVYEGLVQDERHCAVLLYHRTPVDRQVDTRHGISEFVPMVFAYGSHIYRVPQPGAGWSAFVEKWFEDPMSVRKWILNEANN